MNTGLDYALSCNVVENLLISRKMEQLDVREKLQLGRHLNACEQCRAYRSTLMRFRDVLDVSGDLTLHPDTGRFEELRSVVEGKKHARDQAIFPRFRKRAYQAALGVAAMLFAFLTVGGHPAASRPFEYEHQEGSPTEYARVDAFGGLRSMQAVEDRKFYSQREKGNLPIYPLLFHFDPADSNVHKTR